MTSIKPTNADEMDRHAMLATLSEAIAVHDDLISRAEAKLAANPSAEDAAETATALVEAREARAALIAELDHPDWAPAERN